MHDAVKKRLRMVNVVGAAVVVLMLVVSAAFGVYPLVIKGQENIRDTQATKEHNAELKVLEDARQQSEREFEVTRKRLAAREADLPSAKDERSYYSDLISTKISSDAGVQITKNDLSVLTGWHEYKVGTLELDGLGSWDQCIKFLTAIHEMKGLARLDTLRLDVPSRAGSDGYRDPECHFRISISTFFKGEG